ncbi:DUF4041 domain-containing protein [Pirellulales bacterium]|nr:DUF4041 domain-containing protein [Pirellulales bacterium]
MLEIAISIAAISVATSFVFVFLYLRARKSLHHFSGLSDLELYRDECQRVADAAQASRESDEKQTRSLQEAIAELKTQVSQYQRVVHDFKSATELRRHVAELSSFARGCKTLAEIDEMIATQKSKVESHLATLKELGFAVDSAENAKDVLVQIAERKKALESLDKEIQSVEETREMQLFGFYHAKYDFDSSEQYSRRLDTTRADQKKMIKEKAAATCDTEWTVEGSKTKGRKMVNDQIRLLLRAFNGECDAAVGKVRYNNAVSLEKRIEKSFEQINKTGNVNQISISRKYLQLKLKELYLCHEFQEKKQEEKEEQRRIREQIREEEKVDRELKKAKESAEKEEEAKRRALEQARAELDAKAGRQTKKLEELVSKLENELQEAIDRKSKAIARAQLTKSGHVYVLSNIGSFGEGVYKIGMTRRLEPLERVKELGDASVPFYFDVHAMIYSENAPELETKLHNHFATRRVNMVNLRREYFRVSLNEIREAVGKHFGEVTFVTVPEAEQYRETLALRAEMEEDEQFDRSSFFDDVELELAERV